MPTWARPWNSSAYAKSAPTCSGAHISFAVADARPIWAKPLKPRVAAFAGPHLHHAGEAAVVPVERAELREAREVPVLVVTREDRPGADLVQEAQLQPAREPLVVARVDAHLDEAREVLGVGVRRELQGPAELARRGVGERESA